MSDRLLMTSADEAVRKETFDPVTLESGEVLVEVAGCGICHTDLTLYYDYYGGICTNEPLPLTLGHEISDRVVATGESEESFAGKAVVILAVRPCRDCDACRQGMGNIYPRQKMPGNDMPGGLARHVIVAAVGLCPVDEDPLVWAGLQLAEVWVLADTTTTPYQAVVQTGVRDGALAPVVGIGGVGGLCAQIARAFGATVVAIDVSPEELEQAERNGAALIGR